MAKIKITRKILSSYRKLKKEIVVLELELVEMMEGNNGIGVSVVMDYRKGYPQPHIPIHDKILEYDNRFSG